ncbi:hypothetical protein NC796_01765 [Aliifodinibius sp. S!AR15-10]|uniref:hypothetical protein n=1 Tax=Aliifodinibius sp. S!AR15-10 TaxID=2950437 RepID=UPI0028616E4B|nr:hypothetical protein [Aliifodinibius sp. S!AR15-10]MDR8389845.1 hypothetical protein [Aliifodinibius sp. S!AR15-10]
MGIDGASHETIYQWIWAAKLSGNSQDKDLYKQLKHGQGKSRRGNRQDSRILPRRWGPITYFNARFSTSDWVNYREGLKIYLRSLNIILTQ